MIRDIYFGWRELAHTPGCRRPEWIAETRDETRRWPRHDGPEHSCPNSEECGHAAGYERTEVRLVCRSCGTAHVLAGELHSSLHTTTSALGYGSAPERRAGLLLWPGEPLAQGLGGDTPWDYLVTLPGVDRVTEADLVGELGQGRGKRGGTTWWAVAVPDPDGPYGIHPAMRYTQSVSGLKSRTAAAKWITAQLADGGGPQ